MFCIFNSIVFWQYHGYCSFWIFEELHMWAYLKYYMNNIYLNTLVTSENFLNLRKKACCSQLMLINMILKSLYIFNLQWSINRVDKIWMLYFITISLRQWYYILKILGDSHVVYVFICTCKWYDVFSFSDYFSAPIYLWYKYRNSLFLPAVLHWFY